jgi:hypothetical protein
MRACGGKEPGHCGLLVTGGLQGVYKGNTGGLQGDSARVAQRFGFARGVAQGLWGWD